MRDVITCDVDRKREDAPCRYTVQSVEDEFCHVGRAPLCFDMGGILQHPANPSSIIFGKRFHVAGDHHEFHSWPAGRQAEALELRMRIIRIWRAGGPPPGGGGYLT